MVGAALSAVGSSVMDSHAGPCLCVDAFPTSNMNLIKSGGGDFSSMRRRGVVARLGTLELGSSFVDSLVDCRFPSNPISGIVNRRCSRRQQDKNRRFRVACEVAGQYDDSFEDVKLQILNYFTYKAVRTVLNQLYEMNPPQYTWFYNYIAVHKPTDGKRFLRSLAKERQELAERVMVTRLHLYGKWIKKCDHGKIYQEISDENLEVMRERLMETVIWPSDDTNTEKIG